MMLLKNTKVKLNTSEKHMSSSTIINKLQLALDDNQEFLKSIKKITNFSKLEKLNKLKKIMSWLLAT